MNNKESIYRILEDFRGWDREWDAYMSGKNPVAIDEFVESLSKKYEVIKHI